MVWYLQDAIDTFHFIELNFETEKRINVHLAQVGCRKVSTNGTLADVNSIRQLNSQLASSVIYLFEGVLKFAMSMRV